MVAVCCLYSNIGYLSTCKSLDIRPPPHLHLELDDKKGGRIVGTYGIGTYMYMYCASMVSYLWRLLVHIQSCTVRVLVKLKYGYQFEVDNNYIRPPPHLHLELDDKKGGRIVGTYGIGTYMYMYCASMVSYLWRLLVHIQSCTVRVLVKLKYGYQFEVDNNFLPATGTFVLVQ